MDSNKVKYNLQVEYCNNNNCPVFIDDDGICFWCHMNIFNKITEEDCKTKLITGCPYCATSYCE